MQGKELQVGKRKIGKYPRAFREMAVARMECSQNAKELAQELGVGRTALYQWRAQLAPQDRAEREGEEKGEKSLLERENRQLKQALAEKTLEVDFFKGALQKSGLDANATAQLARRHLGPNPGIDVDARQTEYRADVSIGGSQPGRVLPVDSNRAAGGRGHGGALHHPEDFRRTLWP